MSAKKKELLLLNKRSYVIAWIGILGVLCVMIFLMGEIL